MPSRYFIGTALDGMTIHLRIDELAAALAAAEAWWREAGVDCGFEDAPRNWLAPVAPPPPETGPSAVRAAAGLPEAPPPQIGGDPSSWPRDLAAFADWWLTAPTLGAAGDGRRVPPRGPHGAPLMVLVAQPEADDGERLLSGPQGRLLAAIVAALGHALDECYLASVVPAHVGPIDWALLADRGMAAVLAHHVTLAAPRRVLVLGREIVSSLLMHGSAQASPAPSYFHHASWMLPVACATSLQGLLDRPGRKAGVWRTLLEWTGS